MNHSSLRRSVLLALVFEVAGIVAILFGAVMYTVPVSEKMFFEIWFRGIDVAPMVVGLCGACAWQVAGYVRRRLLAETSLRDREISAELEERRRSGRDREPEFLARLEQADSFYALRRRTAKVASTTNFTFLLLVVLAGAAGALWSYSNSGFDAVTIALAGFAGYASLGLVRR